MDTKLSDDLAWRGLIKDKTFKDNSWLDEPRSFYLGIDASSDSLTVGNLAVLLLARRLMAAGWKTVLLAGGATSLIGDPGGKTQERELKPREEIQKNVESIKRQINKLFEGKDYTPADNYDWFKDLGYLDFLREVGKHYSMSELMQREYVSERMGHGGSGISYAEFSYSLIQGYDYWQLYKNHGVVLQIGGSDQWGNMISGVPLIRKKEGAEVHAMSMPLVVNKETGQKFGKSEGGAVWLDPQKTSPTQFYQFWINAADEDVEDYLKVFTFIPKERIEQLMAEHHPDQSARKAQKALADEVTKLVHGSAGEAQAATKYLTGQAAIADASEEDLQEVRQEIVHIKADANAEIVEVLVKAGLAGSNSDARRLLSSRAVYINGHSVEREKLEPGDFQNGRLLLRRGKAFKDSVLVELG